MKQFHITEQDALVLTEAIAEALRRYEVVALNLTQRSYDSPDLIFAAKAARKRHDQLCSLYVKLFHPGAKANVSVKQ
jgi:hypothetical protein